VLLLVVIIDIRGFVVELWDVLIKKYIRAAVQGKDAERDDYLHFIKSSLFDLVHGQDDLRYLFDNTAVYRFVTDKTFLAEAGKGHRSLSDEPWDFLCLEATISANYTFLLQNYPQGIDDLRTNNAFEAAFSLLGLLAKGKIEAEKTQDVYLLNQYLRSIKDLSGAINKFLTYITEPYKKQEDSGVLKAAEPCDDFIVSDEEKTKERKRDNHEK
jgi:hypothetical protein